MHSTVSEVVEELVGPDSVVEVPGPVVVLPDPVVVSGPVVSPEPCVVSPGTGLQLKPMQDTRSRLEVTLNTTGNDMTSRLYDSFCHCGYRDLNGEFRRGAGYSEARGG